MKVRIENITKKYGKQIVLNNVSLEFTDGVYGLLGPNGAGKSTLMNIMLGTIKEDSGYIYFDDISRDTLGDEYLKFIGYLPQNIRFYENYSVKEYMKYMFAIKGFKATDDKIRELLVKVNLDDKIYNKIATLSGGMKQRLGIAQALIGNPKFIILDEPTVGLDPIERSRFREIVAEMSEGRIVLITTHIVSDIEFTAQHIIFMKSGEIILNNSVNQALSLLDGRVFSMHVPCDQLFDYEKKYTICNVRNCEKDYELRVISEDNLDLPCQSIYPSLEDVYVFLGM